VRWVLGEQSAKSLRGSKMEDIIYQGSDSRKALNFAEVTLVLNNEKKELPIEYNEVSITRRVYRSGDSEFYVNKQPCRLKDIVDLFMDTGLGRESFSIIGQGKIDEILSSKAEDRRAIFEEAAGVLKYKQRKNKAVFKLSETADNLDRVEDIIHEITQQLEPLKEQATVAKAYQKKRAELEKEEVALLVTEIEGLHEKWQNLLEKMEKDKFAAMKEKTTIQEKEAQLTKERHEIEQIDQDITTIQNNLLSLTEQIEQLEGKRNVFKERFKHAKENKEKLLLEQSELVKKREQTEVMMEKEQLALQEVTETIRSLKTAITDLEKKLFHGLDFVLEEIEDLKSDYIEYLNEQAVLQNEKQTNEKQRTQIEQSIEREKSAHQTDLTNEENLVNEVKLLKRNLKIEQQKVDEKEVALAKCRTTLISERKE